MKRFNLYKVIKLVYFATIILVGIYNIIIGNYEAGLYSGGAILLGFVPWILERVTKYYLEDIVKGFYLVFIFFSTFLGSAFRMYDVFTWWDIALHVISGVLLGLMSLYLYNYIIRLSRHDFVFNIWVVVLFCLALPALLGCVWEMAEFASDQILGMNTQIVESGVVDTMEDIIANASGSIIATIMIVISAKENRAFNGIVSKLTRKILPIVK